MAAVLGIPVPLFWEVFQLGTSDTCRNVLTVFAVLVALELLLHSLWQRVGSSRAGAAASALRAGCVGSLLIQTLLHLPHVLP